MTGRELHYFGTKQIQIHLSEAQAHTRAHANFDATLTGKKMKLLQTGTFFAGSSSLIYLKGRFRDFFMRFRPASAVILLVAVSASHPTSALITLLYAA